LEVFQDRVVGWPLSIAEGEALRVTVGGGEGGVVGCAAGSAFAAATGTGTGFLAQPAPRRSKNARMIAMAAAL
jgi:hypothetical protein